MSIEMDTSNSVTKKKSVNIIICYRATDQPERKIQLKKCLKHFSELGFFNIYNGNIYIIKQGDNQPFNRGLLLNAGFNIVTSLNGNQGANSSDMDNDIFVFHDVDLLPDLTLLEQYGDSPPIHLAVDGYRYVPDPSKGPDKRTGGIISMSGRQFRSINGYPNDYWGWGGEDDELGRRMVHIKLMQKIKRPKTGKIVDLEGTSLGEKLEFLSNHKEFKCPDKWERRDFHNNTRKKTQSPIGLQYINNYYKLKKCKKLTVSTRGPDSIKHDNIVYKYIVMLADKKLSNTMNTILYDTIDTSMYLESFDIGSLEAEYTIKQIIINMNTCGYVTPISSNTLTFGGKTIYNGKLELKTITLLINELRRSIQDDCNKYRLLRFAHVPKNAGTFITFNYVVYNLGHKRHNTNVDLVVCRNPYERIISTYNYLKMDDNFWHSTRNFSIYGVNPLTKYCQTHTLSEFINSICIDRTIEDQHIYPQYMYSEQKPKYIIRFETLQEDLDKLVKSKILRKSIAYLKTTALNKSIKSDNELTNDDCWLIESFYKKDFEYYDYDKISTGINPYLDLLSIMARIETHASEISQPHSSLEDTLKQLDIEYKRSDNKYIFSKLLKRSSINAVKNNKLMLLKLFIEKYGVDIDTYNIKDRSTLLHYAKYYKRFDITKWLIEHGADTNLKNVYNE